MKCNNANAKIDNIENCINELFGKLKIPIKHTTKSKKIKLTDKDLFLCFFDWFIG